MKENKPHKKDCDTMKFLDACSCGADEENMKENEDWLEKLIEESGFYTPCLQFDIDAKEQLVQAIRKEIASRFPEESSCDVNQI